VYCVLIQKQTPLTEALRFANTFCHPACPNGDGVCVFRSNKNIIPVLVFRFLFSGLIFRLEEGETIDESDLVFGFIAALL